LSGSFLLRLADRQFCALLFQPPPRFTRFEPQDTTPYLLITLFLNPAAFARPVKAISGSM